MKISVTHSTRYRYGGPVRLGLHIFRLRPRHDGAQRLLCHELRIDPRPAVSTQATDQDGNVVAHAWFEEPASALEVESRFSVETLRENPFDFLVAVEPLLIAPAAYPEPLRSILEPYLARRPEPAAVGDFAQAAAEAAAWKTTPFLMELAGRICRRLRPIARAEGPPLAAGETLSAGKGACRDFAVLFCSACRSVGLAARFVSGYELEAARDPGRASMHAWAEVYLPGGGWRGFDPSQGLAVGLSHVAVAAARDPEMATPIAGSYRGSEASTMETSIRMVGGD